MLDGEGAEVSEDGGSDLVMSEDGESDQVMMDMDVVDGEDVDDLAKRIVADPAKRRVYERVPGMC